LPHKNLAAETPRKLFNKEINICSRKFPIQSRSFAELLETSSRKYQNRAIEAAACWFDTSFWPAKLKVEKGIEAEGGEARIRVAVKRILSPSLARWRRHRPDRGRFSVFPAGRRRCLY
jgi:hypothetical protein